ncbi:hypothetical protein M758_2G094300 [Ceratodon purpureus]|nr:hypothetical protein M758_2G094300 [Ceratodon purpureus]
MSSVYEWLVTSRRVGVWRLGSYGTCSRTSETWFCMYFHRHDVQITPQIGWYLYSSLLNLWTLTCCYCILTFNSHENERTSTLVLASELEQAIIKELGTVPFKAL